MPNLEFTISLLFVRADTALKGLSLIDYRSVQKRGIRLVQLILRDLRFL